MNKNQLEHLGDALGQKAGITQVDIIGSQSIHAHCDTPPATVLRSIECDILVKTDREGGWLAGFIREHFGSGSAYEKEKGVFAEAIPRHRAVPLALPSDWEGRTKPLKLGSLTAFCLEPHDYAVTKLNANRPKDRQFLQEALACGLIGKEEIQKRIAELPSSELKAELSQRLATLLETELRSGSKERASFPPSFLHPPGGGEMPRKPEGYSR